MTLEEFKGHVEVLSRTEAHRWRELYIDVFIDSESKYYQEHIQKTYRDNAEEVYDGYLWDALRSPEVISWNELLLRLRTKKRVLAFWDVHSSQKILIPDYWKFGRREVLRLDADILETGMDYLPEDIYIFDEQVRWTLVPTHEYTGDNGDERWCLGIEYE